jgi:hypothetical protein
MFVSYTSCINKLRDIGDKYMTLSDKILLSLSRREVSSFKQIKKDCDCSNLSKEISLIEELDKLFSKCLIEIRDEIIIVKEVK